VLGIRKRVLGVAVAADGQAELQGDAGSGQAPQGQVLDSCGSDQKSQVAGRPESGLSLAQATEVVPASLPATPPVLPPPVVATGTAPS